MKIKENISFSFFSGRYCNRLKNSAWIQSTFITALCLIAYLSGPISMYETSDDVYYGLAFSGQLITNTPSPYVEVINFVLSEMFTSLYKGIPGVPWYGLFHVTSILGAIFFLNYFYAISRNSGMFGTRLVVSLVCILPFLFYIQFTKTSFVLAVAGYLGLYLINESQLRSRAQSIFVHLLAIAFLVLSFSLRKESFLMATILCGFLMAYSVMKRKTALIVSLSAAAAIILILTLVHERNYGVEWQKVSERWEKVISPIIDYDQIDYDANKDVFIKAGWTKNDYNFLIIWGFADEAVYGQKQIDYIFKNANKSDKVIDNICTAFQSAIKFPAMNYILTALCLVLILLLAYRQQYRFYCISVLIPFLICVAVLAWQSRFPPRVSAALIYFLPWATLVLSRDLRKHIRTSILAVIVMFMLAVPLYCQYKDLSALAQKYLSANNDLHRLSTVLHPEKPLNLITVGVAFPFGGILPFESADYLSGARFIWLCSMNQTPIQKKQIAECHMHDIFMSLLSDAATYVVIQPKLTVFLQRYIWEHYNIKTVAIPVYATKSFIVYRIARS